jgi:glycosyltransferase involved in cell wall biosynthesis
VDKDVLVQLARVDHVRFVETNRSERNGNLHQILSDASGIWAPVTADEKGEQVIEELIGVAALSGRPLLVPAAVDRSEVPFVFPFRTARDCANLMDLMAQERIGPEVMDRWIDRNQWRDKAKWFTAIANNHLYYRKTRDPVKAERNLAVRPPVRFSTDGSKVNVMVQTKSLDKGGLEEVILNLLSHFDYRKVNVLVLCEERGGVIAEKCKNFGVMVKVLGGGREKEYSEILRKYSIGCVNPHYATFGLEIAHEMGIPVIPVLHNTYVWFSDEEIAHFKQCDRYVSQYVAVSANVARYAIERFGVSRDKMKVIPNGLDTSQYGKIREKTNHVTRRTLGIEEDDFLFLNVGSFDGRKGHHTLLSAVKKIGDQCPGMKVLCVGNVADPAYFSNIKDRIERCGLEGKMILHDYIEEVSSVYELADAFILPSLIEGWSISVMEAMYQGLPLILTDVGGNGEIIREVADGVLIPTSYGDVLRLDARNLGRYCSEEEPWNADPLAKAMADFYQRRDYWKEQGARGREAVRNRYNIHRVAQAYEDIFLGALRERENSVVES